MISPVPSLKVTHAHYATRATSQTKVWSMGSVANDKRPLD
jgi:hypothetical protein